MSMDAARASRLSLLTVLLGLAMGAAALWLGLGEGAIALWGFGAACLLQIPSALSLRWRIREGLGNSGLERDRVTLRVVSHLLRLLALGLAMASGSALLGERGPQAGLTRLGLALDWPSLPSPRPRISSASNLLRSPDTLPFSSSSAKDCSVVTFLSWLYK